MASGVRPANIAGLQETADKAFLQDLSTKDTLTMLLLEMRQIRWHLEAITGEKITLEDVRNDH